MRSLEGIERPAAAPAIRREVRIPVLRETGITSGIGGKAVDFKLVACETVQREEPRCDCHRYRNDE